HSKEHHPLYWIDDGNIVLSVPSSTRSCDVLFCVHKSTLTRHSSVFADMLSLPVPPSTEAELYESLPLVDLHDSSEEWEKLLGVLYDPMSFKLERHNPDTPFLLDGIMSLATKYQMSSIRDRIVQHIEADWPLTLEEWDRFEEEIDRKRNFLRSSPDVSDASARTSLDQILPEPVSAIQFAKRHSVPRILPAAFYHLSRMAKADDWDAVRSDAQLHNYSDPTARWKLLTLEEHKVLDRGIRIMMSSAEE
ncbi:hypothetical protein DFH11DRAFT_1473218, partial [Phellopilus nigrolimitatus]